MDYILYQAEDFAADESFMAYYLGTDEQAIVFWAQWISLHPEKLDEVYNAERLLEMLSLGLPEPELMEVFDRFDHFLEIETQPALYNISKRHFLNWKILAYAAMLLITVAAGSFYFVGLQNRPLQYSSIHNPYGVRSIIVLSDGTKVSLNSNSTLKYPKIFTGNTRDVTLEGEAFFEVTKDKSRPFTVKARGIKTTVLGTKFTISAYQNATKIRVALTEGSVEVQTPGGRDSMRLKPLEMATYDEKNAGLSRSGFDVQELSEWRNGNIVFNQASFAELSSRFKNAFGIDLKDQTGLKWNYSGQFQKTGYLDIVKSICFSRGIKFKQQNNTIIFTK